MGSEAGPPDEGVVGRDRELDRFDGLLARLGTGQGGAVALSGDPGIGKTRLLAALARRARQAGISVVVGRGDDAELPRPGAGAGIVCLDDLHRLPAASAAAVDGLLERAGIAPLVVAVAYRPRQLTAALAARLGRADAAGLVARVPLAPLPPWAAGALAGDHPDRDALVAAASGYPLYLRVLMEGTGEAAGPLRGELAELDPAAQRVARVAACLGDPFPLDLLLAVSPVHAEQTASAVDVLVAADVLRPVAVIRHGPPKLAFRHPVVARVVHADAPVGERRATHRRIDAELVARGAAAVDRAPHLVAAGEAGRADHVAPLLAAAREVIGRDPATAAVWAEAAGELAPYGDRSRVDARLLVARAALLAGEVEHTRAVLHAVPADVVPAVANLAARAERLAGRYPEAEAWAQDALARAGQETEPATAALLNELAEVVLYRGDHPGGARHATAAARLARGRGDRVHEASALAASAWGFASAGDFAAADGAVSAAAHLVDGLSDAALLDDLNGMYILAQVELLLERYRDARRHAARGVELCRRTGQRHLQASFLLALGNAEMLVGQLGPALATFEEAAHAAAGEASGLNRPLVTSLTAYTRLWLESGSPDRAVTEARQAVADSRSLPWLFRAAIQSIAANVLVHGDEPEEGARLIRALGGGPELPGMPAVRRTRLWEHLAMAALAAGDWEAAAGHAAVARRHIGDVPLVGCRAFVDRTQVLVHGARGSLVTTAERASAGFAEVGLWPSVGITELMAAEAAIDAGWDRDPVRARWVAERLGGAREAAHRCGSARLAAGIERAAARRSAVAEPAWARSLTAREREIAGLAGAGMTSVDIAGRLFLSVRTVDNHLGRIYRKLDVPGRAALAHLVVTSGAAAGGPPRAGGAPARPGPGTPSPPGGAHR